MPEYLKEVAFEKLGLSFTAYSNQSSPTIIVTIKDSRERAKFSAWAVDSDAEKKVIIKGLTLLADAFKKSIAR